MTSDLGAWLEVGLWVFRAGWVCDLLWAVGGGWLLLAHLVQDSFKQINSIIYCF